MTLKNHSADLVERQASSDLTVVHDQWGSADVIRVGGEIDLASAPSFLVALFDEVDRSGLGPVVVDLSAVTFFGAAGLNALLSGRKYSDLKRRSFRIRRPSQAVTLTLSLAGAQHLFAVENQPAVTTSGDGGT